MNSNLSPREIEVLRLTGRGMDRSDVGSALCISPGTVRTHLDNIYSKYEVWGLHGRCAIQAVVMALKRGDLRLEEL
jgi:DNA-binding NarL/FixJ family response regulator